MSSRLFILLLMLGSQATYAIEPVKTDGADIGVTIMGAIVQQNGDDNVALIKEQTGAVKAIKKDHVILEKYKVLAIHPEFVEVVTREGKRYWIYQDKFAGTFVNKKTEGAPVLTGHADHYREDGFERKQGKITMTALYRDKLVKEDLAKILMQATAEPFMENGAIVGFRLTQIDDDSIYAKAGLQDNDIVTAINGQELNSVSSSIKLLQSLKGADHIDLDIRRAGQTVRYTINVQ